MAAPITIYLNTPKKMIEVFLALGTPKVFLASSSYTPDQDAHDFILDVTNEAAGAGYTAGGVALDNVTVTLDAGTNLVTIGADDWLPSGLSVVCRWGVIYVDTGVAATSPVLAYIDLSEGLGGDVTVTGVQWDAAGIVPFAVAA